MVKQTTSYRMEPEVAKFWKDLSAEHGVPVGDILKAAKEVLSIGDNLKLLKSRIVSSRDTIAVYIPDDINEAQRLELQALLQKRSDKFFEMLDDDRENHGNK